jgi:hypothetical protein
VTQNGRARDAAWLSAATCRCGFAVPGLGHRGFQDDFRPPGFTSVEMLLGVRGFIEREFVQYEK